MKNYLLGCKAEAIQKNINSNKKEQASNLLLKYIAIKTFIQ